MRLEGRSTGWERQVWACGGCVTRYLLVWRERCDLDPAITEARCPRCGACWQGGAGRLQQRLPIGL